MTFIYHKSVKIQISLYTFAYIMIKKASSYFGQLVIDKGYPFAFTATVSYV